MDFVNGMIMIRHGYLLSKWGYEAAFGIFYVECIFHGQILFCKWQPGAQRKEPEVKRSVTSGFRRPDHPAFDPISALRFVPGCH